MTDVLLSTDEILKAFTRNDEFPRAALKQAMARPDEVNPPLLAAWEAAAQHPPRSNEAINTLLFGAYLLARSRDTRLYRPLCAAARDPELFEQVFGDAITEDLWLILVRCFDGDQAPLRGLIEDPDIDEFVRGAGFRALTYLTASGRISRDETASYLRDLYDRLQPRAPCYVWAAWQYAIGRLGLAALAPLVKEVFARKWVEEEIQRYEHFEDDLNKALKAEHLLDGLDPNEKDEDRLDDLVKHMSGWSWSPPPSERPAPSPAEYFNELAGRGPDPLPWGYQEPYHNPYRHVGRNDPCPCGSGKKFKKCCLGKI